MPEDVLSKILQAFIDKQGGINKGCKTVAKRLNNEWSWKYLYHVYRGTCQPSQRLIRKLKGLRTPNPPRKRYRMITEALSKEQFDSWPNTMEERRDALDEKVKGCNSP